MRTQTPLVETFLTLRRQLARLVTGIVPPKEVEDIVQETYVRVCQSSGQDKILEPRSFLFRTARNLALDHVKRAEVRLADGHDKLDEVLSGYSPQQADLDETYAQVASDEEFAFFCEAVRELPKQRRRAFILKKVYGYTLKEIASEMEISTSTVESHIVAGTKRCVELLRRRQDGCADPSRKNARQSSSTAGGGIE